jgi:hypothetical protein
MRIILFYAASVLPLALPASVEAHGGGLNKQGCHNDRKNGGYHCHGGGSVGSDKSRRDPGGSTYYPNCSAARDAGAAPVRRGDPGYSARLDRDGDGVGCE